MRGGDESKINEHETATYHSKDILLRSMGKMKQLSLYIQQASEPHLEVHGPDGELQHVS